MLLYRSQLPCLKDKFLGKKLVAAKYSFDIGQNSGFTYEKMQYFYDSFTK